MPTLDEMRNRLRDGTLVKRSKLVKTLRKKRESVNFVVSVDGDDALLKFGKHNGKKLSEVVGNVDDGYSYVRWIAERSDLPLPLKDVSRHQLEFAMSQLKAGRACGNCEYNGGTLCPRKDSASTTFKSPACKKWVESETEELPF